MVPPKSKNKWPTSTTCIIRPRTTDAQSRAALIHQRAIAREEFRRRRHDELNRHRALPYKPMYYLDPELGEAEFVQKETDSLIAALQISTAPPTPAARTLREGERGPQDSTMSGNTIAAQRGRASSAPAKHSTAAESSAQAQAIRDSYTRGEPKPAGEPRVVVSGHPRRHIPTHAPSPLLPFSLLTPSPP